MPDKEAQECLDNLNSMAAARSTWEGHWDECARYTRPNIQIYPTRGSEGAKNGQHIFDSTVQMLVQQCASIIDSTITPRNDRYHGLQTTNPELNKIPRVRSRYERMTEVLFQKRYEPQANFIASQWEAYLNIIVFGTGPKYVSARREGRGMFYRSMMMREIYARQDNEGRIDTVYRKYPLTARQAAQEFGAESLPERIRKALEGGVKGGAETEFEFIHAVSPNSDYKPRKFGPNSMKFRSQHVSIEGIQTLRRSGYRVNPYIMGRMSTEAGETYGRSLVMTALADTKMLNAMGKGKIRAMHRAIDPPMLTPNDGIVTAVDLRPGAINAGGVSPDGKQLIVPMQSGMNWELNEVESQRIIENLKTLFMVNLIQLLRENPQMTATEVMEKAYEKGMLLAPTQGRLQSEDVGPTVMREIDVLDWMGFFPSPTPEEIEAEGEFEITYTAPLNRAQKAEMARGSAMTVQEAINLAAVDPTVLDALNMDEYLQVYGEAGGASMRIFRSPEEIEAIRQQRAQEQQMMALTEAAPKASRAALDVARARKTESEIPARV